MLAHAISLRALPYVSVASSPLVQCLLNVAVDCRKQAPMANNSLMFTDSVICFKELIEKEDMARRTWREKYGARFEKAADWRPVEPFEQRGASCILECSAEAAMCPQPMLSCAWQVRATRRWRWSSRAAAGCW